MYVILLPSALCFLGGAWLVAWSTVSSTGHAVCRRCGYDLSAQRRWDRCPECGAQLTGRTVRLPGAVYVRWGWFVLGLALMVVTPVLCALGALLNALV